MESKASWMCSKCCDNVLPFSQLNAKELNNLLCPKQTHHHQSQKPSTNHEAESPMIEKPKDQCFLAKNLLQKTNIKTNIYIMMEIR